MADTMTPARLEALFSRLQTVDTPTVCNAIEVAQGQRGFSNFTRKTLLCAAPEIKAIVGYARTASIRAVEPPTEDPEVIKQRRMDYYRYMSEGERPGVVVIEDVDWPDCIGAFWGEVNTAVHAGFGLRGVVTNGVMRDLDDLQPGFQVLAHSIGPSHGFVHVLDVGQPVEVLGMRVKSNDVIHADKHGALVIPEEVLPTLSEAIDTLLRSEKLVLDPAREEGFDFEAFEQAWAAFEKART